jgi:hypothetical protein
LQNCFIDINHLCKHRFFLILRTSGDGGNFYPGKCRFFSNHSYIVGFCRWSVPGFHTQFPTET